MKLAHVLADARADADMLDRRGHATEATSLRKLCNDIEAGAREYLTFLSEIDAALFTGETPRTLQRHFAALERRGHAYRQGRMRFYRECVLTPKADRRAAFDAGAAAARTAEPEAA